MTVRKVCRHMGCRASPRCHHPWYFDVMHNRKRWRMPVDEFAIARGATAPITSKETAVKVWEPKFVAEIRRTRRQDSSRCPESGDRRHGRRVPRHVLRQLRRSRRALRSGDD
jgi:hypothetical protein